MRHLISPTSRPANQAGLTITELLIGLAIVSILVTVVAPNIQSIIQSNRVVGDINQLSAALRFARFSAINDEQSVVLCPTENYTACVNDWQLGKMAFVDDNGNGSRDADEPLLVSIEAVSGNNMILGVEGSVTFLPQGTVSNNIALVVCPSSQDNTLASGLYVTQYGRISVATDSDNNGVKEDLAGDELSCSNS